MSEAEKPPSIRVRTRPVDAATPAASAPVRALQRRATLLTVLTSPGAWMRFFRDKNAPKFPKLIAVLALLYVVSPVDAVPELFAPFIGFLDDLGVATIAATWLASVAAKYANKEGADGADPAKK